MTKVTIDLSRIRNEINQIKAEAFLGLNEKSDGKRRDILSRVVEQLKTLLARLSPDATDVEVK